MTSKKSSSRRQFLVTAGAAATTAAVLSSTLHAAGSDEIKVGVIGIGGRGTGAAFDVLRAAKGVRIVAVGDAFEDRLQGTRPDKGGGLKALARAKDEDAIKKLGNSVDVPKDRQFVGLDAFEKVLACDLNYVILATPPGFRPIHIAATVAAGKNLFTEKPVGVDGPGIRRVLEAATEAKTKKLGVAAGTQRRHQTSYNEIMKRVHAGEIGEITGGRCYWNQGGLWHEARTQGMSDLEWQIRNWLYFTALSGDHIVEQHVHNLDVINWALKSPPVRAVGMGGRAERTQPQYGHIFDHFTIDYEYPNGVHILSMARQIPGCEQNIAEAVVGSMGGALPADRRYCEIKGEKPWKFDVETDNAPYVQEHTDLIASIRKSEPINELKQVAESTLTAIMGRMSAYSGKAVKWEEALASKVALLPEKLDFEMKLSVPAVAIPGKSGKVREGV